ALPAGPGGVRRNRAAAAPVRRWPIGRVPFSPANAAVRRRRGGRGQLTTRFEELLERREAMLLDLAVPILVCQAGHDSPSPMFHGCFDWHSCVHAVWALHAIADRTGEEIFLDAASQQARADLVEAELAFLRDNPEIVAQENPYGFAWTLQLAAR